MPGEITLCSFMYNDAPLLDGLLASLADWHTLPVRAVVVDDGSSRPWSPPATPQLPITLIRHPENKGTACSIHDAVSQVTTPLALVMDNDVRLPPDWIETVLEEFRADPRPALASSLTEYADNNDAVSQYLNTFARAERPTGVVPFVGSGCWLLDMAAWREVGGMEGHLLRTHGDHFYCAKLGRAGHVIRLSGRTRYLQTRIFGRLECVNRFYIARSGILTLSGSKKIALAPLVGHAQENLALFVKMRASLLVYIDLLRLCHTLLSDVPLVLSDPGHIRAAIRGLYTVLARELAFTPRVLELLFEDLTGLGHADVSPVDSDPPQGRWEKVAALLRRMVESGCLEMLNESGIDVLRKQEESLCKDVTMYAPVSPR